MQINIEMEEDEVEEYVELKARGKFDKYGNLKTALRVVEIEASILNKVLAECYYDKGEEKC